MLSKVSDFYDSEVQATTEALTSLIEPLLIAFLGVVVGGMIIALYLPIFSIATAVK
jgi:type IV pilus assembly protein PilC